MRNMSKIYIIAEAGVNHNGNLEMALDLIKKSKKAGADCVKFQTFKAENIVTESSPKAAYQLKTTSEQETQFSMLKSLELGYDAYLQIKKECENLAIDFISTPYHYDDVDFLDEIGVSQFKIASSQLTELPFLEYVAKKNRGIILSTGMASLSEVFEATQTIKAINSKLIVLQCTTNYPSLISEANINAMLAIKEACKVDVGYSDHVENNFACFAAAALGAKVIEKHFTLDKSLPGPDHVCSLDPNEFKEMVYGIRQIESALGNGIKLPTQNEKPNIFAMRRSIVAAHDINRGEVIKPSMLTFKRPFGGIEPKQINLLIGKKLKRNISYNEQVNWNDFE